MSQQALLEFRNVSKAFGAVQANQNVSFKVEAGSIHALVGENGAGKSTIVKILFGLYQKDQGEILFRGQPLTLNSPFEAKKHGIGMVHQHFMLAGPLTALEHIFLDEASGIKGLSLLKPLPFQARRKELEELSRKYQMPVPWETPVSELSVGFQQRIEILKLLHNQAEILILDEPTAVLTPQEIEALFAQLRDLRKSGKTIIIITHKMKEVMSLADEVTVFRQGQVVAHRKVSETTPIEISELMVGRKLHGLPQGWKNPSSDVAFEIHDFSFRFLQNLNLKIRKGEIVGIAGVEGNGQSELIEFLLNPSNHQAHSGDIIWNQKSTLQKNARQLKEAGFSYFPEDRLRQGALLTADVENNFILGQHHNPDFQKSGWLNWKKVREVTHQALKEFDVRPANPRLKFQNLSGGNQQKLVVARELYRQPSFLLAAQPTRGVDIGAIERIHLEIVKVRERQGSVLLISSDLDELMKLSDRIVVIFQGKFVGELTSGHYDEMKLGCWMTGAQT